MMRVVFKGNTPALQLHSSHAGTTWQQVVAPNIVVAIVHHYPFSATLIKTHHFAAAQSNVI